MWLPAAPPRPLSTSCAATLTAEPNDRIRFPYGFPGHCPGINTTYFLKWSL
jgi:hypothetical protein